MSFSRLIGVVHKYVEIKHKKCYNIHSKHKNVSYLTQEDFIEYLNTVLHPDNLSKKLKKLIRERNNGFFVNQLNTVYGCVLFTLGVAMLVVSIVIISKKDKDGERSVWNRKQSERLYP